MPASGHQDHTTSPSALAPFVKGTISVHRIPPHVRDDRETPLCWDGTESKYCCFYRAVKRNFGKSETGGGVAHGAAPQQVVIPRHRVSPPASPMTGSSRVSSTPGLIDSIACVSGTLDRPLTRAMTRGGMRARREFSPISFFQTATTQGASKPSLRALAKQSMEQRARLEWIASSRSLSSGAHSRDPLAPRNDGNDGV
jgi:hypothetical protein